MKIVVTGSGGRLGAALLREFQNVPSASQPMMDYELGLGSPSPKFDVVGFNHAQLDLSDSGKIREALSRRDFDVLINAAAFTNVDLSEKEKDQAFRVNAEAPRILAEICREKNARFIHFSTDYVFSGEKEDPYVEEDEARPIGVYGESKLAGEKAVLDVGEHHLVIRVSWVFGPDRPSFVDQTIARARENESVAAVADKWSAPTYTRDIAEMLLNVVGEDASPARTGILHFANMGRCSWQEYTQHALDCCREVGVLLKATTVTPLKMSDMKSWIARRPVHTVLSTEKYEKLTGNAPRSWQEVIEEYVREFVAR